jgi:hypothetical protein
MEIDNDNSFDDDNEVEITHSLFGIGVYKFKEYFSSDKG